MDPDDIPEEAILAFVAAWKEQRKKIGRGLDSSESKVRAGLAAALNCMIDIVADFDRTQEMTAAQANQLIRERLEELGMGDEDPIAFRPPYIKSTFELSLRYTPWDVVKGHTSTVTHGRVGNSSTTLCGVYIWSAKKDDILEPMMPVCKTCARLIAEHG